jgi:hypothetical protein
MNQWGKGGGVPVFCRLWDASVSKTKRPDAHGFSKRYDKPATPLDRVAASEHADPAAIRRLTALRERTNPIRLLEDIRRRHALILRKQDAIARREA